MTKLTITLALLLNLSLNSQVIRVGSKHFNESYILGEVISQLLEANGYQVERRFNLGGTLVCFESLMNSQIDVYPEYTGTITEAILKLNEPLNNEQLNAKLKTEYGLEIAEPFGFNNTYAFAMKRTAASKYNVNSISDLKSHPNLRIAFSYEFLKRKDGWENLARTYGLTNRPVGIEHGLAYQALDDGKIDLTDVYSTDGEIPKYDLKILADDKSYFPKYYGVAFYRTALDDKVKSIIAKLSNTLTDSLMQSMNAKVLYEKKTFAEVASEFLKSRNLITAETQTVTQSVSSEIASKTLRHLEITFVSLLIALVIAVPLGVVLYIYSSVSKPMLYIAGLLQTIPSIALLAIMIPLFGIGLVPAVVALFLYALLPILRNTAIGLFSVDPLLRKVATGMGLTRWQRLRYIEIPLAMPTIFAGIKTAAVINIGTATLAAFIGAGGLGEFIVTGLALNNTELILRGAVPAAMLAIVVEFAFEMIERIYIPKHLKQKLGN
ncbi:MAG: ABC transporter permease subunit [Chlorobi bacterium]|nr:ABC transporter permease subunit [Chlorobiota bacterium]MCI0716566.1 ABC transporter permease subunit [Chlorobiota bacterium]